MNEHQKSTNDVRLIAQDAIQQQERVCQERGNNLATQLSALTDTVQVNAEAIAELTQTVTVLATTVTPLDETVKAHTEDISKLQGRPAVWAAIGAALPTLLGVLLWWFSK